MGYEAWGKPGWFRQLMGGDGLAIGRETMQPVFDFIDRHADRPFFIWYGPSLPHTPLDPPFSHYKYYANTALSESAKQYYANCTWFDAGVGELLDHIEARGLRGKHIDRICQRQRLGATPVRGVCGRSYPVRQWRPEG